MSPTIHWFLLALGPPLVKSMLKSCGNDKFAPLETVWSHPLSSGGDQRDFDSNFLYWNTYWTAAPIEHMMTVKYNALGWVHLSAMTCSVNYSACLRILDVRVFSRRISSRSLSSSSLIFSNSMGFWAMRDPFCKYGRISNILYVSANISTCSSRSSCVIPWRGFWILNRECYKRQV